MSHVRRTIVVAMLLVAFCGVWSPLLGQDDRALQRLGAAFDATVAAHLDRAKADTTIVNQGRYHRRRWEFGGSEVHVFYSVETSGREAAEMMRYKKLVIQLGVQPLKGFGDESYWLPHYDPAGGSVLYCRRGRVVLEVYAPAPDDFVKKVTSLFLAEVEKELAGPIGRQ